MKRKRGDETARIAMETYLEYIRGERIKEALKESYEDWCRNNPARLKEIEDAYKASNRARFEQDPELIEKARRAAAARERLALQPVFKPVLLYTKKKDE
jgi:hypothetical protein